MTVWDYFYLHILVRKETCNLAYGFVTYFDTMSNKSRGALCGGNYVTRLVKNLKIFYALTGLT